MAIGQIANGEAGSSVRGKLNDSIDDANRSRPLTAWRYNTFYDSFQRENANILNAESGQTYTVFSGTPSIPSGGGSLNTGGSGILSLTANTVLKSNGANLDNCFTLEAISAKTTGNTFRFYIITDASNYVEFKFDRSGQSILQVTAGGAPVTLATNSNPSNKDASWGARKYQISTFQNDLIMRDTTVNEELVFDFDITSYDIQQVGIGGYFNSVSLIKTH